MLVLSAHRDEEVVIRIDGQIVCVVKLTEICHGNKVRLGFAADRDAVEINRRVVDTERYGRGGVMYQRDPMLPKSEEATQ